MHLVPFYRLFPGLAEKETRTVTTFGDFGLPADDYALVEYYCPDPECDCRRVMLNVFGRRQTANHFLAAISYGFDRDDEDAGPFLDPLNPQSEHAEALLDLVEEVVLSDQNYVARLESHYRQVKEATADPSHPVHERLRELYAESEPRSRRPRGQDHKRSKRQRRRRRRRR